MKKIFYIIPLAVLPALAACEGNAGEEGEYDNEYATGVYTLVADKTVIEADGSDAVTFKLYSPEGEDLTASSQVNYITVECETTGETLDDMTFTAIMDGDYEFSAIYKNYDSDNKVTVTAQNRAQYEKYFRKVAVYDVTNAQCYYCGVLAQTIENMDEEWASRMVLFGIHGAYSEQDPWLENTRSVANSLLLKFNPQGSYPSLTFNLDEDAVLLGADVDVVSEIRSQLRKYPAHCGVKISSSYDAGTNAYSIDAELTASASGEFDLGCALLLDNQTYASGIISGMVYNDIVRQISENYMQMSTSSQALEADGTMTNSWSGTLPDSSEYAEHYRVVVFALRDADGTVIIDNVAECPLGESVDYLLNE